MRREAPGKEASHGGGHRGRTGWVLHTAARPPCSFGTVGLHTCHEGQLNVLVGLNKQKKGSEEKKQETVTNFCIGFIKKKFYFLGTTIVKSLSFLKRFVWTWSYEDPESWNPFPAWSLQQDHSVLRHSLLLPPRLSCLP